MAYEPSHKEQAIHRIFSQLTQNLKQLKPDFQEKMKLQLKDKKHSDYLTKVEKLNMQASS